MHLSCPLKVLTKHLHRLLTSKNKCEAATKKSGGDGCYKKGLRNCGRKEIKVGELRTQQTKVVELNLRLLKRLRKCKRQKFNVGGNRRRNTQKSCAPRNATLNK